MRGYFLLAAAYDAVRSTPRDAGPHRTLVKTIVMSPETMAATKAAAEDIAEVSPVEEKSGGYISLNEAGEIANIHPQSARRKAKKKDLLKYVGGHPLVERMGWYKLHQVDPDRPSRRRKHPRKSRAESHGVGKQEAASKGDASQGDDVITDEIDDEIADLCDQHPGKHLSVPTILRAIRKTHPHIKRVDVVRVLQAGKKRGDYDSDDHGDWFRTMPK